MRSELRRQGVGSAEWVGEKRRAWEDRRCRKWGAGSGVASRTGCGSKGSENAGGSLSRLVLCLRVK